MWTTGRLDTQSAVFQRRSVCLCMHVCGLYVCMHGCCPGVVEVLFYFLLLLFWDCNAHMCLLDHVFSSCRTAAPANSHVAVADCFIPSPHIKRKKRQSRCGKMKRRRRRDKGWEGEEIERKRKRTNISGCCF